MLSRSLLARSLLATLRTQVCSRSPSSLRLVQPAAPCTNLRRFFAAPAFRAEYPVERRAHDAPSGTCYISNIPYKVTAEELKDAFSEFGNVESVKLLITEAGLPRGCGFVRFESVAGAVNFVEAHEADPIFVLDRQLNARHAKESVYSPGEPSNTLLLNLEEESEVEVRTMFGHHAERIQAVRIRKNHIGRVAYIQFCDVDVAMDAMDAFKNTYGDGDARIKYAGQSLTLGKAYALTSRRSQHLSK